MSEYDEEYWDAKCHKSGCEVWGDEDRISPCTCGPAPHEGLIEMLKDRDRENDRLHGVIDAQLEAMQENQ